MILRDVTNDMFREESACLESQQAITTQIYRERSPQNNPHADPSCANRAPDCQSRQDEKDRKSKEDPWRGERCKAARTRKKL